MFNGSSISSELISTTKNIIIAETIATAAGANLAGDNSLAQKLSFLISSDELIFLKSSVSKFLGLHLGRFLNHQ